MLTPAAQTLTGLTRSLGLGQAAEVVKRKKMNKHSRCELQDGLSDATQEGMEKQQHSHLIFGLKKQSGVKAVPCILAFL